ncbi:MAG TPA: amino acid adenylation domain-containing protein, partial [Candidatus Kapabacteria bacterium]|nr:amino acid adenylation domain-containing protein [Candidatus Kapabacteria bacterium]
MEKLNPQHIENILALTAMQEGMLFHYLRDPQSENYFEQLSLGISGAIDGYIFEKAWNTVVQTNEMLRTVFRWEKLEKPSQVILKEYKCRVIFHDLSNIDSRQKKTALEEIKNKDRHRTFDLHQVPFRVTLCKLAEKQYEMFISNHHILYDGWSNGTILKEFFKVYHELSQGEISLKLPPKSHFKEFIKWVQSRDRNKQEYFWRGYLYGFETPAELPIKNRIEETNGAEDYSITLEEDIKGELDAFVQDKRVTLASVFYAAWGILLQKYCGSEDVIFGTTVSGRSGAIKGIENMVGLFINTIPLRTQTAPGGKIIDVVFQTDQAVKEREEFENTSLVDIGSYSGLDGGGSLFDTIVAIENYPLDSRLLPGNSLLSIDSYSITEMTHYDLSVSILLFDKPKIKFSFKQGLFEKEIIENLARHFKGIIRNIIENPGIQVSQLEIISSEEKNRILYEFNNTAVAYPKDKAIQELFAEQAARLGDRIAAVAPETRERENGFISISYRELNDRANGLAHLLIEKGVRPDTIVGIMIERSIEMIIGIYGILKAGGAYLPIDMDYPRERIEYMVKDSKAQLLLTSNNKNNKEDEQIRTWESEHVFLESAGHYSHPLAYDSEFSNPHAGNLAYAIYTSGSTGKPKGVVIQKKGFLNLLRWYIAELNITKEDNNLLIAPISFDLSQKNLFSPFLTGGRLTLASAGIPDYRELTTIIHKEHVTMVNCAPSVFYPLVDMNANTGFSQLHSLRAIVLGGEPILADKLLPWVNSKSFNCEIINTYGPTECTDIALSYRIPRENLYMQKGIPIGKPISNAKVYILDKYLGILPLKIPGELCIGGIGLSNGYYNNIALTLEKFIDTPGLPGKRVYRTGDLARWLPDGNIDFLGRIDHQVKIRGFRIELGEIESELSKHKEIKDVVVIARQSKTKENYLCAYIVSRSGEQLSTSDLRAYLRQQLPDYMIPAYFVYLDRIPLTPSGKVDRR